MKPQLTDQSDRIRAWSARDLALREAYLIGRAEDNQRELALVQAEIQRRAEGGGE